MTQKELLDILSNGVDEWNKMMELGTVLFPEFNSVDFRGFELTEAIFFGCRFDNCNFGDIILQDVNFFSANIKNSNFDGADLTGSNLSANISKSSFRECNFLDSSFDAAEIKESDFFNSYFEETSFVETQFSEVDFTESEILYSIFGLTHFNGIIGFNKCKFLGPSIVDFETILRSENLEVNTLRGLGLPDKLIEYLPSFREQPIQFYSCFISFTENDNEFSLRLYNDLQQKGIRCWRWKEDAKWGEKLISEIDKAVKLHDKLIVILSEESLKSEPVIREIERALQREAKLTRDGEKKSVLFPIRVDDSIFKWNHPLQADLVERNIGDFRNWKDHDSYQKDFKKLVKDLKAE